MPQLGDDFIEEVRSRNDIVDVVSGYLKLTRRGSNYFGLCPFHGEKTASFSVSPGKQMYYCFGCGAGGNVFTFVMEYENFTFLEAVGHLANRAGMEMPKLEQSAEARREADRKSRILEVNKEAANYYYKMLKSQGGQLGRDYFQKRQLSEETIKKFGLGYSLQYSDDLYKYLKEKGYSDELLRDSGLVTFDEQRGGHDKFWNRVMFPILDVNNHVIGFGGRVMGDAKPKYLNSPETAVFDKSRNLYGLNVARTTRRPNIILCEGYMDVISLHQAGFTNAAASLGTALTPGHARLLKRYTKEALLCYDSDGAGVKAALRAIPILKEVGISTKVIHMDPYKDPDEFIKNLGAEAFEDRISQAQNSFLFQVSAMQKNYDMNDPEKKTEFFNEVARMLTAFTEELERNNYMEAVASEYGIPFDSLRKLVNKLGLAGGIVNETKSRSPEERQEKRRKQEDGLLRSQKLFLTILAEDHGVYQTIRDYIAPEDFEGDLYRQVAEILFGQLQEGTSNPAQIISLYTEEDRQREVAAMFNGETFADMTKADKEKALAETLLKMKQRAIDRKSKELAPTDIEGLQKIIADKKALQKLKGLQIKLNI